jgi:hypothetical protein
MERRLAAGAVTHTVVRPEYLLNNLLAEVDELARGRLVAPSGGGRCPFVDARDVGAVAAAVLLATEPPHAPLDVTGPESLSWAQLAGRLQGALGRPVEHIDPDPAEWVQEAVSAGMRPWLASALAEYFETLRERPLEASDDTRRVIGRRPRSVEDFTDDVLAPANLRRCVGGRGARNPICGDDPHDPQEPTCLKELRLSKKSPSPRAPACPRTAVHTSAGVN